MPGLRSAVLLVAASCGFLLLLAASASASSSSSRPPVVYGVGVGDGTDETLGEWAMRHRFYVGDVLDFKHFNDSVLLLVHQGDYERCRAASPVRRFAAAGAGDDNARFTLGRPGLFYFISAEPARCEAGQRMVVRVGAGPLPSNDSGARTPAPGPQPDSMTPLIRRRHSLSMPLKQMVAGALGFAAGFTSIFLIVWISVCCRD